MHTSLFWAIALILALGFTFNYSSDDPMAKCQEKHSYDTCFQIFNR